MNTHLHMAFEQFCHHNPHRLRYDSQHPTTQNSCVIVYVKLSGRFLLMAGHGSYSRGSDGYTNTDYEIRIVTAPTSVRVYLNGALMFSKNDGITAAGGLVGLASYNAKFTAKDISLTEVRRVTRLTLNKADTLIKVGNTEVLTANTDPADASVREVTWSSGNTGVATVDANGVVTGAAPGTAFITATALDGGLAASCMVMVNTDAQPVTFTTYNVSADNMITNIEPGTTVTQFRGKIQQIGASSSFTDINGQPVSDKVGTGTNIEITLGGNTYSYTAVILGDVDGNGIIDLKVLTDIQKHLLSVTPMKDISAKAGDLYQEGAVTLNDLAGVLSHIAGAETINQDVFFKYLCEGVSYVG